ncbi:FecR family protein [Flavitalea flava]
MQEDRFWLLVSLKLSGEATPEELSELDALLQASPEMGLKLDMLNNIWREKHPGLSVRKEEALNKHLLRLSNHFAKPALQYETISEVEELVFPEDPVRLIPKKRWLWTTIGAAAAIIGLVVLFSLDGSIKEKKEIAQNTVSTKPGSKSKIQLPDGTQVWLNADSRITYNENFQGAGNSREVQLTGEAYFDVAKDKDHPFIIHTSSIDVNVLGTSLNIRSYTNEKNTETVLIRGSIEVTLRNHPDKKIILKPNEKLVVKNEKAVVSSALAKTDQKEEDGKKPIMIVGKVHFQKKDSTASEVMWVKNKLVFDGESLEEVVLKIERWYNVKVRITDESLKSTQYSGVFEDESLKQVMEALRLTGNFRYLINKKEVIIKL